MINRIVDIIVDELKLLNFCNSTDDKIYGIAKTIIIKRDKKEKKIPAVINTDKTNCNNKDYIDLIPNTQNRTLIYFEDNGTILKEMSCRYHYYNSSLRLVLWCNLKKINQNYLNTEPLQAVIIRELEMDIPNFDYISQIKVEVGNPAVKESNIFGRYDYDEGEKQYLLYPYDYFAIDFNIYWAMARGCVDEVVLNPAVCPK